MKTCFKISILLTLMVIYLVNSISGQTTVSLNPVQDANINSLFPDINIGNSETIDFGLSPAHKIGKITIAAVEQRALMQFDVSSIPTNAIILTATLNLYGTNHEGINSGYIEWITGMWQESGATWNSQPSSVDMEHVFIPQSDSSTQNYQLDISFFVNKWVKGAPNNGILFRKGESQIATSGFLRFASKDFPDPMMIPRLDISYILPLSISYGIARNSYNNYNLSLTASGGVEPYSYLWNNGAATASLANISGGLYHLGITDNAENTEQFIVPVYNFYKTQWAASDSMVITNDSLYTTQMASGFNSYAISENTLHAGHDGCIQFNIYKGINNFNRIIGLTTGNTFSGMSSFSYGIYQNYYETRQYNIFDPQHQTNFYIIENGVLSLNAYHYHDGDLLQIVREGNTIKFLQNNIVFYETTADPAQELKAVVTMEYPGAHEKIPGVSFIDISPLQLAYTIEPTATPSLYKANLAITGGLEPYNVLWNNGKTSATPELAAGMYSVTVTDDAGNTLSEKIDILMDVSWTAPVGAVISADGLTVTKNVTSSTWASGAGSKNVLLPGLDGMLRHVEDVASFNANKNKERFLGIMAGSFNASFTAPGYGFYFSKDNLSIVEAGVTKANLGKYTSATITEIVKDGNNIMYYVNDVVVWQTAVSPGIPYIAAVLLKSPGAYVANVKTTFPLPFTANYTITNASNTTYGEIKLNPAGGLPPYKAVWGGGNLPDIDALLDFYSITPEVNQYYTFEEYYNIITTDLDYLTLKNLTPGKYPCSVYDSYGQRIDLDPSVGNSSLWSNAIGITVNGDILVKTGDDGWGTSIITLNIPFRVDSPTTLGFKLLVESQVSTIGLHTVEAGQQTDYNNLEYGVMLDNRKIKVIRDHLVRNTIGWFNSGDELTFSTDNAGNLTLALNGQSLYSFTMNDGLYVTDVMLKSIVTSNGSTGSTGSGTSAELIQVDGVLSDIPTVPCLNPHILSTYTSCSDCYTPNGTASISYGSWNCGTVNYISLYDAFNDATPIQTTTAGKNLSVNGLSNGHYYYKTSYVIGEIYEPRADLWPGSDMNWINPDNAAISGFSVAHNSSSSGSAVSGKCLDKNMTGWASVKVRASDCAGTSFGFISNTQVFSGFTASSALESTGGYYVNITYIGNNGTEECSSAHNVPGTAEYTLTVERTTTSIVLYLNNLQVSARAANMQQTVAARCVFTVADKGMVSNARYSFGCGMPTLVPYSGSLDITSCSEPNMNTVTTTAYNGSGNPVSMSRIYSNRLGMPLQTQTRLFSENKTLVTQNIYNLAGLPALVSLPAPLCQNFLCYKPDVLSDVNKTPYSWRDFEAGEMIPADNTMPNTTGWYYGNNNTLEPYVDATAYPFSLAEYYTDPLHRVKKVSQPGDNLHMGSGRETRYVYLNNAGELAYVTGQKTEAYKTVMIDADGNEFITFTDPEGKTLATCRSGLASVCYPQRVRQNIPLKTDCNLQQIMPGVIQNEVKFHLPVTKNNSLDLNVDFPVHLRSGDIIFTLTDLETGRTLNMGTDYTVTLSFPEVTSMNISMFHVSFKGSYATRSLFLKVTYDYSNDFITNVVPPYTSNNVCRTPMIQLFAEYETDYSNWTLYYYDYEGHLKETVPPEGVDCRTYVPGVAEYEATYSGIFMLNNGNGQPGYNLGEGAYKIGQVVLTSEGHLDFTDYNAAVQSQSATVYITPHLNNPEPPDADGFAYEDNFCGYHMDNIMGIFDDEPVPVPEGSLIIDNVPASGTQIATRSAIDDGRSDAITIIYPDNSDVTVKSWVTEEPGSGADNACDGHCYNGILDCGEIAVDEASDCPCFNKPRMFVAQFSITLEIKAINTDGQECYNRAACRSITYTPVLYTNCHCDFEWDSQGLPDVTLSYTAEELENISRFEIVLQSISVLTKDETLWTNLGVSTTNMYHDFARFIWFNGEIKRKIERIFDPSAIHHEMQTVYTYDKMNRVSSTTSPDGGTVNYVYRNDGKPRFSQNSQQAAQYKFSYSNYDNLGRVVETGEVDETGGQTFAVLKSLSYSGSGTDNLLTNTAGSYFINKTNSAYDLPDPAFASHTGLALKQEYVQGKLSKSWNNNITTWYGYDEQGRVKWMAQKIAGLGVKTTEYTYDFNGKVTEVNYQRGQPDNYVQNYEYDADLRLKKVIAGGLEQAEYFYYLHGPLKRIELADDLQGIDYTYTANGWLKAINHPLLANAAYDPGADGTTGSHAAFGKDMFGMIIDYYSGDYNRMGTNISYGDRLSTESYSGLIKSVNWNTTNAILTAQPLPTTKDYFTYRYNYDKKQMLTNADFGYYRHNTLVNSGYGAAAQTNAGFTASNNNKVYGLSYDNNGNIKALNRDAYGTNPAMDKLVYTYETGTNKLLKVKDNATADIFNDFKGEENYTYNNIGQLIQAVSPTGTMQVEYNQYDKVSEVTVPGTTLSYFYNERGQRIRKHDAQKNKDTWYVRDLTGNVLSMYETNFTGTRQTEIPIYGTTRLGTIDPQSGKYMYELTDYLGNVRAVIEKDAGGNPVVASSTDYYPFGMELQGLSYEPALYSYSYNGKEKMPEWTGANSHLDFGERIYNSFIGRWMVCDPMTAKYPSLSPYQYAANNPIIFIDPDGRIIRIYYCDDNGNDKYYDYGSSMEVPNNDFVSLTLDAISQLQQSNIGQKLINELDNSEYFVNVNEGFGENSNQPLDHKSAVKDPILSGFYLTSIDPFTKEEIKEFKPVEEPKSGSSSILLWSPETTVGGMNLDGSATRPSFIGLGHEFYHAFEAINKLLSDSEWKDGIKQDEWDAVHFENILRLQLDMVLRQYYGDVKILNDDGTQIQNEVNSDVNNIDDK